jgi:hypothetical protein|tara:strand:- start:218 stop:433 length:216 start_codon:yes stop_codon:yes gene_type:complete
MKRTNRRELYLDQSSPKVYDLNKISTGCAPCLKEALKIDRQVDGRSLNEIKIDEIKTIVRSIFKRSKNVTE